MEKLKLEKGDTIKFKFYSNIDPYPTCIGTVEHVYGVSYRSSLLNKDLYEIDVMITDVLNNHWAKNKLIGHKIRIRSDFDIEKIEENQK